MAIKKVSEENVDKGIELYRKLKKTKANNYNFTNENELSDLGYEFLHGNKGDAALKIFSMNNSEFPDTSNVYDSRGEAYFNKKEFEFSQKDYQKVSELEPTNPNAKEMLLKIEKEVSN